MISAMPAVAVRRGRKKSKTFGRFGIQQSGSHHSSISSLNRARSFSKRGVHQSVSTITGINQRFQYRPAISDIDVQRKRFLIYLGTLFLITGLLLTFIGVGSGVSEAQMIGLLLIGIGAILCITKVFYSEAQMTKVVQKVPVTDESEDSADNLAPAATATMSSNDITPLAEVAEFNSLPVSPTSNQDSGAVVNSHPQANNSRTPTSGVNNVAAETQVLIPEGSEKY